MEELLKILPLISFIINLIVVVVWAIRLEGKVNKNYQEFSDHKKPCEQKYLTTDKAIEEIKTDAKEFNRDFDRVTGEMYKVINKLENVVSELKGFMSRESDKG